MGEPWEKRPDESARSFQFFATYRDMGPSRSLDKVTLLLRGQGDGPSTCRPPGHRCRTRRVQIWSRKYSWPQRAQAWDDFLDGQVRSALVADAIAAARRHADQARALQATAIKRLMSLNPSELSPKDVLAFVIAGAKLEADSMATLTALTAMPGTGGAAMVPAGAAAPSVVITRQELPPALPTPAPDPDQAEADVRMLPFAATVTALAG